MKKFFRANYFAIIMALIYIPIVVMIVFSFNSGSTVFAWRGGSFYWYEALFKNSPFIKSIITSLFVALIATVVSLLIGVSAAIGLNRCRYRTQQKWEGVANIPLINADVVTAVSLMMVFLLCNFNFGLWTLILAHISFDVPYVLITVMPRLRKIDPSLLEAGEDLGANNWQLLTRVILPVLKPAIIAAAAIAFAMSFDDFIISYFTGGSQTNVSTFIYTAKKIRPYVFAFGTILVAVIILGIVTWNAVTIYRQGQVIKMEKIRAQTYKLKTLSKLNKELNVLEMMHQNGYRIVYAFKPTLWTRYWWLKLKIKLVSSRNYDKKITRLEWKRYKLRAKINQEKRYYHRQEETVKRLKKLEDQFSKTTDIKKAARLTLQIEKVLARQDYLAAQILELENREELAQRKVQKIVDEIADLTADWTSRTQTTKREAIAYQHRLRRLEAEKNEIAEGKNNYKLRLVVERLCYLQDRNYNYILVLTEKKNRLAEQLFQRDFFTPILDNKIKKTHNPHWRQRLIAKQKKMRQRFEVLLVKKINAKKAEIVQVQTKIRQETLKMIPPLDENDGQHLKGWFARSWKLLATILLTIAAFVGLTMAYVLNNTYDLVIGNWGEYIDPTLIHEFEKENQVRVNYQEYDSNETLYNKLYTFDYDLMIPSDYMVAKLAQEGRLEPLNYQLLNVNTSWLLNHEIDSEKISFDSHLEELLLNYQFKVENENVNLLTYSVPYFWGDLAIVVKPTTQNLNFLRSQGLTDDDFDLETGLIKQSALSWKILWAAAQTGKQVALNNDPKNIYALAAEVLYQRVNLFNKKEIDQATTLLKSDFINKQNVSLNNDELISKVGTGNFDFALMYNGDALEANRIYNHEDGDDDAELDFIEDRLLKNEDPEKFLIGRPNQINADGRYQTTNVFSDNMAISKFSKHKELAYQFINFIYAHAVQISEYVGITSPVAAAMAELTAPQGIFSNYKRLYYPCVDPLDGDPYKTNQPLPGAPASSEALAFLYQPGVDDYLVDQYNNLLAGKIV